MRGSGGLAKRLISVNDKDVNNFDIVMAVTASDFPQLCESCLGSSPYVKMQRIPMGGTCKICTRNFELFKWRPGRGESYKRTEVTIICHLLIMITTTTY